MDRDVHTGEIGGAVEEARHADGDLVILGEGRVGRGKHEAGGTRQHDGLQFHSLSSMCFCLVGRTTCPAAGGDIRQSRDLRRARTATRMIRPFTTSW